MRGLRQHGSGSSVRPQVGGGRVSVQCLLAEPAMFGERDVGRKAVVAVGTADLPSTIVGVPSLVTIEAGEPCVGHVTDLTTERLDAVVVLNTLVTFHTVIGGEPFSAVRAHV